MISHSNRYVLSISVAAVMLAACGRAGLPIGAPGAMPQNSEISLHPDDRASWMAPGAKKKNLLYIAGHNYLFVYSYPRLELEGRLAVLFGYDESLCSETNGDVFVPDLVGGYGTIYEYGHGGRHPIASLSDPHQFPWGCAVDPTTGNLAVASLAEFPSNGAGNVAIYPNASGSPTAYTVSNIYRYYYCGYDDQGNLYVDGKNGEGYFELAKLPRGSSTLESVSLNQTISWPGGVQWDGKNMAIGDASTNVIYQFSMSGSTGSKVGETTLNGPSHVWQFWIQGAHVVAPLRPGSPSRGVGIYDYPAGGSPIKRRSGSVSFGATVSLAPSR